MLTCAHCSYSTTRLYNLNRHLKVHQNLDDDNTKDTLNSKEENFPNVTQGVKNVTHEVKNVTHDFPNVTHDFPNVTHDFPNVTHDFPNVSISENGLEPERYTYNEVTKKYECNNCYKSYVTKYRILKHYCQKIQDPCECPNCHLVLSSSNCKSKHMKHCYPKELTVTVDPPQPISISTNAIQQQTAEYIQNNIHKTMTNNVNSHNTNTNNIVVFHFNNEKPIPLHYDHITQKMIQQLFNDSSYPMDSIREYAQKVLERPENLCVKKKHIRDPHSLVHVGDNKWESRVDKEVYPRLTYNISSNLLEYIEEAQQRTHFSERLGEILNDIVSENNPNYKETLNRIKLMVVDFTKSLLESKK